MSSQQAKGSVPRSGGLARALFILQESQTLSSLFLAVVLPAVVQVNSGGLTQDLLVIRFQMLDFSHPNFLSWLQYGSFFESSITNMLFFRKKRKKKVVPKVAP